jgi:predicted nucleic acid-binding protein
MPPPFLDTNVLLRHILQDHSDFSPKATAFIVRVERGALQVRTSDVVIFETVFTLQRSYKQARQGIADVLLPIIELPGIILPGKRRYRSIFRLYCTASLGFADCYHLVMMRRLRLNEILSFDTDFDGIPWLTRREV